MQNVRDHEVPHEIHPECVGGGHPAGRHWCVAAGRSPVLLERLWLGVPPFRSLGVASPSRLLSSPPVLVGWLLSRASRFNPAGLTPVGIITTAPSAHGLAASPFGTAHSNECGVAL